MDAGKLARREARPASALLSCCIKRWADLPDTGKYLAVRRAVTAMSVGWVTRDRLAAGALIPARKA